MSAFKVVQLFEQAVADYAGSKYAVATNTGTSALHLSMLRAVPDGGTIIFPAFTFVSVPMMAKISGFHLQFEDEPWQGVYQLKPWPIWDGALRFTKGMYRGGLHCLSFQARKILNIGEGGMILTDSLEDAEWLRAARYLGRKPPTYGIEEIESPGFLAYMSPEKAARGLHLMEYVSEHNPDQIIEYNDMRNVKFFKEN